MRTEILDLDNSVANQPELGKEVKRKHDLTEWGPKIRMGCAYWRFSSFARNVPNSDRPRLSFIGSGDFHHVTLALLKKIQEPFHLVILDKHPDWVKLMPIMHCGTWLSHALKLPQVKNVYHFGGDLDFDNFLQNLAPRGALKSGRVKVFPSHRTYTKGFWKKISHQPLRPDAAKSCTDENIKELLKPHAEELSKYPLYISVDKDVMRVGDSVVNWDSGLLRLKEIELLISNLIEINGQPLVGADIVGDWSRVRLRGPLREMLDWSEHPVLDVDPKFSLETNQSTNLRLLDLFKG